MTFVIGRLAPSGGGERLARAGAAPNRSGIIPSSKSKGVRPSSDACEEVALSVALEIVGSHVDDASLIDIAGGDVTAGDEVSQPGSSEGIELVVVSATHLSPLCGPPCSERGNVSGSNVWKLATGVSGTTTSCRALAGVSGATR